MRSIFLILVLANSAIASDFVKASQLFHQKNFSEAFTQFEAVSMVAGRALRQACFYNMGNCAFRIAEEEENMPMEWFRQSIECYRAALRLGAGEDAAHNLELARWRLKQFNNNSPQESDQPGDESQPSDEGEGEGESSDSGDESEFDDEGDYSDDAGDADSSSMPRGDTSMSDLESQATPPPGVTPEDLLQEEALNNAQRQKSKSQKGGGVEQDW